uniref:Uncharacterized protein n=1 Tax=Sphaerodactylus townsendi TaxID=933632 RepID=A0ACB8EEV1_9SAUR
MRGGFFIAGALPLHTGRETWYISKTEMEPGAIAAASAGAMSKEAFVLGAAEGAAKAVGIIISPAAIPWICGTAIAITAIVAIYKAYKHSNHKLD